NDLSISLFNESDTNFNLLVFENENIDLYKDKSRKILAGNVQDINFRIVTIEYINNEEEMDFYVNYKNRLRAYFKPHNSIPIFPKEKQQVKFKENCNFHNQLNTKLKLDPKLFDSIHNKICYSISYLMQDNILYEAITYKNEVVGFFPVTELEHLIRYRAHFKIINEAIIYKDSFLTKRNKLIKEIEAEFISDFVIPSSNVVRFKYQNELNWIPIEDTNI